MNDKVIDALKAARSRLTHETWRKGSFTLKPQFDCALTALQASLRDKDGVLRDTGVYPVARAALASAIPSSFVGPVENGGVLQFAHMVIAYNDDPSTTLEDIHRLFDRAIEEVGSDGA